MGIRTGQQYIDSLRDGRALHAGGNRVADVTTSPAFRGVIDTIAALYDAQHTADQRETLTFVPAGAAAPVSATYLSARTQAQAEQLLACFRARADLTYGLMGRLSDFMSAWCMDQIEALTFMCRQAEAEKARWYRDFVRDHDLAITHTLIDPQTDRSKDAAPDETVHLVERRRDGIVVRGARLLSTLAPVANEVLVGPYQPRLPGEEDKCLLFSLPMNSPGLTIVCREPYSDNRSVFDRPLTSRYDEGDAVLLFDNVFVPDERVILAGDLHAFNNLIPLYPGYTTMQAVARSTAKLRFLTGVAALAARVTGRDKLPRYREILGELVCHLNVAEGIERACTFDIVERLTAYGVGQPVGIDGLQSMGRTQPRVGTSAVVAFFPMVNKAAYDAIRVIGGSGPITFTEQDFEDPALKPLLEQLMIGPGVPAKMRLQAMKLIWDITGEQFGARQALYERHYSGDPIKNMVMMSHSPKYDEAEALVFRLLGWELADGSLRLKDGG
ncbi:MAG: 4-hydroxyphenylacetate 3-hydroxylase [Gammaproteobacteria bacterium]|nr:4-hydroxyphenylacetate 3-hydroxylase [Gammaproteobacteria bacterium]